MSTRRIGVMFDRARPPEELVGFAQELESAGVDELWVVEDIGWGGAIAAAATALASTEHITVGIGIMPAPLRNPALLAMELASLERCHPGRLIAGLGHGVGAWMQQVGALVGSPLTLLEETLTAVRALLSGATVTVSGRYVKLDHVGLMHPPLSGPPLLLGVSGPKSLRLAGRLADGTILVEGSSPDTIRVALQHISPSDEHKLLVFTHLCIGDDPAEIRTATEPVAQEFAAALGVSPGEVFMAAGRAEQVVAAISALWESGVETVILRPVGGDPLLMTKQVLRAVAR